MRSLLEKRVERRQIIGKCGRGRRDKCDQTGGFGDKEDWGFHGSGLCPSADKVVIDAGQPDGLRIIRADGAAQGLNGLIQIE